MRWIVTTNNLSITNLEIIQLKACVGIVFHYIKELLFYTSEINGIYHKLCIVCESQWKESWSTILGIQ